MESSQIYYFVATCIASIFGFGFAWSLNRFTNTMDKKMEKFDSLIVDIQKRYNELFSKMQGEISDLKQIAKVNESRIEHLEDKVYPVRHPTKNK